MKRTELFSKIFGVCTIFICVSPAISQIALRKALDYDGDGKADLAVYRSTDNSWYFQKSGNQQTVGAVFGLATNDVLTPGDYDGDGKGDIAVWRESNGQFYYVRSSNSTVVAQPLGTVGDEPVARDYDGDGKTDCALVRRQNNLLYWYILQSSNNIPTYSQWGIAADFPAPGDYDGDGHFDLAVQREGPLVPPANVDHHNIFYIYGSLLGSMPPITYGYISDTFVPGDYDGDGKTDIAVLRKSFYYWYIRKSSDGAETYLPWGSDNLRDMPVQADYDGDGKTDIAVWRPWERNFYIKRSSDQQQPVTLFGALGDLPVAVYDTH